MADIDRRKRFVINVAYWLAVIGTIVFFARYVLGLIWPFFLAFIFSWMLTPAVRWLTVRCHIKHAISSIICLVLFFGVVGGLFLALILNLVSWVQSFVNWLPGFYAANIDPLLRDLTARVEQLTADLDPDITEVIRTSLRSITSSLGSFVSNFSLKAVGVVSGWITQLPGRLLSTLICIIATVFLTMDFHRVTAFLLRQLPARTRHVVVEAKESFLRVVVKYGKSYGIIMTITFVEISIGLLILRQDKAILLALLIAIFDIFPIVGAGFILIPWGIVQLLTGAIAKGLGLFAMYIIITVIRQFMEPRIVGHQMGMHPLVTLIAMLVGTKLFGPIGLLGLPIACAIIKSLDDTGVIHVIRKEDDPEMPAPPKPEAAEEKI